MKTHNKLSQSSSFQALAVALPLLAVTIFGATNGNFLIASAQSGEHGPDSGYGGSGYGGQKEHKHVFSAHLSGLHEVPPVNTETSGIAHFNVSKDEREIDYNLIVHKGKAVTGAHLHCAPAGANGPVVVSLFANASGVDVNGLLSQGTIVASDILPLAATCNPNITTVPHLVQAMREGQIYVNVHTVANPNGEVRGQLSLTGNGNQNESDKVNPKVSVNDKSPRKNTNVDFTAKKFAPNEQVNISKTMSGTTTPVGSRTADGGGNFSTGSINVGSTTGSATYTFTGVTSGASDSVVLNIIN